MKKYLMLGIAALSISAGFTSCSSEDDIPVYTQDQIQRAKYETNFVQKYGNIGAGQNWGFSTVPNVTRGIDNKNNMWAHYINVPDTLTNEQKAVVRDWFQKNRNPQGIAVNWSDFWVQQVYKGGDAPTANCPEIYRAADNHELKGSDHMDKLTCGTVNEHIEKFNDGTFNGGQPTQNVSYADPYNDQNRLLTHPDMINLMVASSTECFGYNNSESSEQRNDNYVIIPGDRISPIVAGMYFVGLDFEAEGSNPNMQVAADGYYSDWIVRITPGEYKNAVRIVCEDLGTTDDFDFNDVVFDAYIDGTQFVITLRAAGGTLPLYVGGTEVHAAMGVGVKDMVNTGVKTAPIAIYRIPISGQRTYSNADYDKIEIKVEGNDAIYVLQAPVGKAPEKILVDDTFDWPTERQGIGEKYNLFSDYTQNPSKYTYSRWWNQN